MPTWKMGRTACIRRDRYTCYGKSPMCFPKFGFYRPEPVRKFCFNQVLEPEGFYNEAWLYLPSNPVFSMLSIVFLAFLSLDDFANLELRLSKISWSMKMY